MSFTKYTNYIFDLDGTLVDSMPFWSKKILNILDDEGICYPDDIIKIVTPLGDKGAACYMKEVLNVKKSVEEILSLMDSYAMEKYKNEIKLKKGVFEYLNMLKSNNCSLNVLTASPSKMAVPCLEVNKVFHLFDNVWSCDDFNKTKADPSIYVDAVERIKGKMEETVFFDDNIIALETGKKAGLFTVGVYDKSSAELEDKIKSVTDLYISSFCNLNQL